MFFIFLCSVSVLTVLITVGCVRVLSECYLEGVKESEEMHYRHHDGANEDGMEFNYEDDTTWLFGNGTNNDNNNNNNSTLPQSLLHQFHYHIALQILSKQPIELAFGLFGLLCAWSITSLTCFHALIITLGQTTNERVRGVYQYGGVMNPADRGCWRNWMEMMWRKVPESRLPKDFSDVVDLNDVGCGEVGTTPIVLEESVWPGWQESRLVSQSSKVKSKK
jgi:hypothetical protein